MIAVIARGVLSELGLLLDPSPSAFAIYADRLQARGYPRREFRSMGDGDENMPVASASGAP